MAELVIKLVNGELAGKTMQGITKEVNAAALAVKKAEVGTQAWVDASKKLEDVKKLQGDLKKQIEGTTAASDMLKKAWNTLPGAQFFNQIGQSLGMMKSGVGGLVTQFGVLKTAIISTGLGALVVLLGSLYAWFTKTERGGDFLSKSMAALGAAFDVVIDRGSKLIDALIALWDGDYTEAAKKFGEATSDVTGEIIRETKAAWELADALDQLEELEGKLILVRSRSRDQISELRLLAKDETKTIEERTNAIKTAMQITDALRAKELQAAKGRIMQALHITELSDARLDELLAKGEELITVDNLGFSEAMQEDLNKAMEALAHYNEVNTGFNDEQRALTKELNNFKKKERAEDTKDAKDAEKAEKERLKALEDAWKEYYDNLKELDDMKVQAMDDGREKDFSKLKLDLQREIEALDQHSPFYAERLAAAQELARQKRKEINDKWDKKDLDDKLAALDLELATEQNILNERLLSRQITEAQFVALSGENAMAIEAQRLEVIKAAHGERSIEYQRAYAEFLNLQKEAGEATVKEQQDITKKTIAAIGGAAGVFGNLFDLIANRQAEGTAQWRHFAIAAAIMSTIQGAINAYSSTAAIPYIGPFLAPAAAAVALAAGYANVKKIENTKPTPPTKKARGGVLHGPSHAHGGIPIEAENEEIILTKNVYRNPRLRAMASDINVAAGGVKFAAGGPVNPFQDRPAVRSTATTPAATTGANQSTDAILMKLDELIAAQDRRIDRFKVINVATETDEIVNKVKNIQASADV